MSRRHVLGSELGLMEPWNDVHLLLIIPPTWGRDVQAECLRICFERFGLAGVYFGETPVLAALGCAQANAVVVDIGHDGTDVSVVWDGHLVKSASERFHIGAAQVDQVIASALKKDSEIARHFGSNANWNALARQFKETGSLTDDNGNTVQVQAEILSEAAEVYFKDSPGLQHVIMSLVNKMDPEKRPLLLDSIVLTGLGCQLRGLSSTFTSALTSILPVSGFPGDHQSNKITLRHVPEYYPEVWQAAGPVCAWFGAGITAKMVFPDNKAHYTKEEYVQMGAYGLLTQKPL